MAAIRGCNSVVECHLPMVNVVGSSPIARFKICTVTISSSAIATILDRNQDYLQIQYLTPLLRTEKLKHFRQ